MKSEVEQKAIPNRIPDSGSKWGILGGAFDPVHNGHLNLADAVYRLKKLDGVLLVPTLNHPTKNATSYSSYEDRIEMLSAAVESYPHLSVSSIEKEPEPLSGYTLHTVIALKQRYPGTEFSFIVGADKVVDWNSWYRPSEILQEVRLLIGTRPECDLDLPSSMPPDRVEVLNTGLVDISSSKIRTLLASDLDSGELTNLVPEKVLDYIVAKGLYQ
jgi:nicotinate-nucleotide adenylyltransferase